MTFNNLFTLDKDLQEHNTRSSDNIDLAQKNYKKYSIKFKGSQIWNNLPTTIKNCKSTHTFKKRIRKHLLCELINRN